MNERLSVSQPKKPRRATERVAGIPTMGEAGLPGVEVLNWQGLLGPMGLPAEIVRILNAAGNNALQDPEQRERMLTQGKEIGGGTPEQFAALIKAESPR